MGTKGRPFKKGQSGNPAGRPPGIKDAATLVGMALEALDRAGGVAYLVKQAKDHPTAFLGFIGRLLPQAMKHEHTGGEDLKALFGKVWRAKLGEDVEDADAAA